MFLLSYVGDVPTLTPTLATMLGLGVGIDYALFIVTRYRKASAGLPVEEAVARAIATSGQAGPVRRLHGHGGDLGTVGVGRAVIGLIGTVSSLAVAVAVLAALSLLPALLASSGGGSTRSGSGG